MLSEKTIQKRRGAFEFLVDISELEEVLMAKKSKDEVSFLLGKPYVAGEARSAIHEGQALRVYNYRGDSLKVSLTESNQVYMVPSVNIRSMNILDQIAEDVKLQLIRPNFSEAYTLHQLEHCGITKNRLAKPTL